VPALILRAGDFFGPGARSSWFSQAMIAPGKSVKRIMNPARGGGHSWAYLPDLAETFALLLDHPERLRPFERLQFEGHYDDNGHRRTDAIRSIAGRIVPVRAFPWWAMRLLSPFNGFMREAAEIAPYWRHPVRLDNARLVELLGAEPRTPLAEAVRASLHDMGSLEAQPLSDPHAANPGYGASKTALNAITLAFAIDLEAEGIKVNAVSPGFTKTALNNYEGTETVQQGAAEAVRVALLGSDGLTGTFTGSARETYPW